MIEWSPRLALSGMMEKQTGNNMTDSNNITESSSEEEINLGDEHELITATDQPNDEEIIEDVDEHHHQHQHSE